MPNLFVILIVAAAAFCIGFFLISIPGIRNSMKKLNKRFSDEEMEKLTNYRNSTFASSNEEYSKTPTNLE